MVALLLLALGLMTPPALAVGPVFARQNGYEIDLRSYHFAASHLSPLLTYTPASAWSIDEFGANATEAGARVSVQGLGAVMVINGNQEGARFLHEQAGEEGLPGPDAEKVEGVPLWELTEGAIDDYQMFALRLSKMTAEMREYVLELGEEEEEGGRRRMEVLGMEQQTLLPTLTVESPNVISIRSAVNVSGSTPFFRGDASVWTRRNITRPLVRPLVLATARRIPSPTFSSSGTPPFPVNATLYTNTTGAPLRFTAPISTSFVQLYGSVGPDMGEYQLRLLPRSDVPDDFELDQQTYTGSAQRPVESSEELLVVAYLDPRVEYDLEFSLTEEGKGVDMNGAAFVSYITEYRRDYVTEGNWYAKWNEKREGVESGALRALGSASVMLATAMALWASVCFIA